MAKETNRKTADVTCEVCNCAYHDNGRCKAGCICVGPSYACSAGETVCSTFKPEK